MRANVRKKLIAKLAFHQGMFCCYCGCDLIHFEGMHKVSSDFEIPNNAVTIEHLKRKKEGGSDELDNLALACVDCNRGRGNMDWFTYKTYKRGELFCEAA